MFSYRKLQDYWFFSRKYKQFDRVSSLTLSLLDKEYEVSEEAQNALRQLDRERAVCQDKIGRLNLPSSADCATCRGQCCGEPSDHYFTSIDFWLNKYSKGDAVSFSENSIKPFRYYFRERFKTLFEINFRLRTQSQPENTLRSGESCFYLGENGCKLPHSERPMKCLAFACARMKRAMDDMTRAAFIENVQDLHGISLKTFNIIKAEARYPAYYGYVTITFIP